MNRPADHAMVPPSSRLSPSELMPPEAYLRPARVPLPWRALGGFTLVLSVLVALTFSTSLAPLVLVVMTAALVGVALWKLRRLVHANEKNQRAVNLLGVGEIDEAGELFDELARSQRGSYYHVLYVFNCGVTATLAGKPRRALSILNAVDASKRFRRRPMRTIEPVLYLEIAACLTLLGWLDEARAYRRRAAEKLSDDAQGRAAFVDALIAARSDDPALYTAGVDLIEAGWRDAEGMLTAPALKALRLVGAFMLERLGREHEPSFETLLAGVRPHTPGDFDWIAVEWPDFRAFLDRHGLR